MNENTNTFAEQVDKFAEWYNGRCKYCGKFLMWNYVYNTMDCPDPNCPGKGVKFVSDSSMSMEEYKDKQKD